LVPTTIAPNILRFLVLVRVSASASSAAAEHLVEEAELRGCCYEEGGEDGDEGREARHFDRWGSFSTVFSRRTFLS
jgi:hypothetical protein